jgi:hypothetical protein
MHCTQFYDKGIVLYHDVMSEYTANFADCSDGCRLKATISEISNCDINSGRAKIALVLKEVLYREIFSLLN